MRAEGPHMALLFVPFGSVCRTSFMNAAARYDDYGFLHLLGVFYAHRPSDHGFGHYFCPIGARRMRWRRRHDTERPIADQHTGRSPTD